MFMSIIVLLATCQQAKASFIGGFFSLLLKPVTIPVKLVGKGAYFIVKKTFGIGSKVTKASLRNVSIQSGPVKVRPFDFR